MAQTTVNDREVRFRDGLGLRVAGADHTGDTVEQLRLTTELAAQESAIRERVGRLVNFRHVKYVRLRGVDRLKVGLKELVVTYDAIEGDRLSTILDACATLPLTIDVDVALQVVRDLLPGIGILHDSRKVTHGAIAPERLIYTHQHRLIIVDHGFGLALSKLNQPRKKLWDQYRIAVPQTSRSVFDERTDVIQIGLVALAVLLGRPLIDDDYPGQLKRLVLSVKEHSSKRAVRPLTPELRQWLERALPVDEEHAFKTVREAQDAFETLVTKGRYAPTAAGVKAFLTAYREKARESAIADQSEAPRGIDRELEQFAITIRPSVPSSRAKSEKPIIALPAVADLLAAGDVAARAVDSSPIVELARVQAGTEAEPSPVDTLAAASDVPLVRIGRKGDRSTPASSSRERVGDAARRARHSYFRSEPAKPEEASGTSVEAQAGETPRVRGRLDALRALEEELTRLAAVDLVVPRDQPAESPHVGAPVALVPLEPATSALEAAVTSSAAQAFEQSPITSVDSAAVPDSIAMPDSIEIARIEAAGLVLEPALAPPDAPIVALESEVVTLINIVAPLLDTTPTSLVSAEVFIADEATEPVVADLLADLAAATPAPAEAAPRAFATDAIDAELALLMGERDPDECATPIWTIEPADALGALDVQAQDDAQAPVLASIEDDLAPVAAPPADLMAVDAAPIVESAATVESDVIALSSDDNIVAPAPVDGVVAETSAPLSTLVDEVAFTIEEPAPVASVEPDVTEAVVPDAFQLTPPVADAGVLLAGFELTPPVPADATPAHTAPLLDLSTFEQMASDAYEAAAAHLSTRMINRLLFGPEEPSVVPALDIASAEPLATAEVATVDDGAADAQLTPIEPAFAAVDAPSTVPVDEPLDAPIAQSADNLVVAGPFSSLDRLTLEIDSPVAQHPVEVARADGAPEGPSIDLHEDAPRILLEARSFEAASAEPMPIEAVLVETASVEIDAAETGFVEAGLVEAGLVEAGLVEAGLVEAGPLATGPVEAGLVEADLVEAGSVEAGPVERGPFELAPVGLAPVEPAPVERAPVELALSKPGLVDEEVNELASNDMTFVVAASHELAPTALESFELAFIDLASVEAPPFELSSPTPAPLEPVALEMAPVGTPLLEMLQLETPQLEMTLFATVPLDALPQDIAASVDEARAVDVAPTADVAPPIDIPATEAPPQATAHIEALDSAPPAAPMSVAPVSATPVSATPVSATLGSATLGSGTLGSGTVASATPLLAASSTSRRKRSRKRNKRRHQPSVVQVHRSEPAPVPVQQESAPLAAIDLPASEAPACEPLAPTALVEAASADGATGVEARAEAPQSLDAVSFFEWDPSQVAEAVPAWARGTAHAQEDQSVDGEAPQGIGTVQFEAASIIDYSAFGAATQTTTTPPWQQREPVAPSNIVPFSPSAGHGAPGHAVAATAGEHASPAAHLLHRPTRFRINWARTLAASLVVALLEGVAFAAAWWYVTPNEKGWLVVHTRPSDIEIAVDGMHQGRTPFVAPLAPGRHTIELRQGTATRLVPVEISAGVQTEQRITWGAAFKTGQARITSSPEGALVTIDGKRHGKTPVVASELAAGKHTVMVETSAGSVTATLIVEPGETTELEVPVYSGWVSVLAPVSLDIFVRGRLIGTTEAEKLMLAPGAHKLELVNEELGYRGAQIVEVRPGATTAVSVLPKTDVTIEGPTGVELLVDGESAGQLPIGKVKTLLGTREFVFRSSDQPDRRQVVIVTMTTPVTVKY